MKCGVNDDKKSKDPFPDLLSRPALCLPACLPADDTHPVTYGSVLKLKHHDTLYYLNSEEKNLNSGSGQQIVTLIPENGSHNTLWWIRLAHDNDRPGEYESEHYYDEEEEHEQEQEGVTTKKLAHPVKCGATIRLTHLLTGRNLHSHGAESPLSRQQEVTAFGEGDTKGDAGDNWVVNCLQRGAKHWNRGELVTFQHVDTSKYLGSSKNTEFNLQTCGRNCPILGHLETFGRAVPDKFGEFYAEQGVYLSV